MFSYAKSAVSSAIGAVGDVFEDAADAVKDAADDFKSTIKGDVDIPEEKINPPTPEDCWFHPARGWPSSPQLPESAKWKAPPQIAATAADFPQHYADEAKRTIGEVRIEVLEAENLPKLLQLGRMDPYCVVICEGCAGRTNAIANDRSPQFVATSPRAFKFPLTCPFSICYVALKDEDRGAHDDIGRVALELGGLRQRTVYDCWFPLQYGQLRRHAGKRGSIRLRFSVNFTDERRRLLQYLQPFPTFSVPFVDADARMNSAFAYRGKYSARRFRWALFDSHVKEILAAFKDVQQAVQDFLFWHAPFLSLFVNVLYQWLISRFDNFSDVFLILACIPMAVVAALVRSYLVEASDMKIYPSIAELLLTFCGGSTRPISESWTDGVQSCDGDRKRKLSHPEPLAPRSRGGYVPLHAGGESESDGGQRALARGYSANEISVETGGRGFISAPDDSDSEGIESDDDKDEGDGSGGEAGLKQMLGLNIFARESLDDAIWRLDEECEAELTAEALAEDVKKHGKFGSMFNPLASALGPIQVQLGKAVVALRIIRRVTVWSDRMLTLQLCLLLLAISVALVALELLLSLLPWSLIFEWIFRIAGFVLLGPHMYFYGRRVEERQRDWRAQGEAFDEAGSSEREATCAKHKARIMAEKRALYHMPDPALWETSTEPNSKFWNFKCSPNPTAGASLPARRRAGRRGIC
jgi:hypothetical protein